jgi:putative transcriptional regulator
MAIVKVTKKMRDEAAAKVDWAKIDAMSDDDIARQVAENPDAAPLLDDAQAASAMIAHTRKRLGLSQAAFAERYGIPVATLRDWEQGRRQPDKAVFSYLRVIQREPEMVAKALEPAA